MEFLQMPIERPAIDELNRKERVTASVGAGVDQARDIRVIDSAQDVALLNEALVEYTSVEAGVEDLDGSMKSHAIRFARSPVNHAESAFADALDQLPASDAFAGLGGEMSQGVIEEGAGLCVRVEQPPEFAIKDGPALAFAIEKRRAVGLGKRDGLLEQVIEFTQRIAVVHAC